MSFLNNDISAFNFNFGAHNPDTCPVCLDAQDALDRENGYTVVNFDPGIPFSADLLAALLLTDEELESLGLTDAASSELEWALSEVEAGNLLSTDEASVLAEEIYRLEEREDELTEALAEAESDVDALSADLAAEREENDELADENIRVWLDNEVLRYELDIATTLNLVGATALAEASRALALADAIIQAQAAELRRLQARELTGHAFSLMYLG